MKKPAFIAIFIALGVTAWNSGVFRRGAEPVKLGLASITVPEGFEVSLAAKPGLVRYPMLGTIAPDGVIYMCESSGKTVRTPEMTADPTYVITKLEDTDRDGVYDKSTVFADKLTLPAGAVWLRGSLYVAAPPLLVRLEDTNGDGVADVRETVVEGWNLSANAASLHGPILGPDGWLYLTDGRHGFNIKTKDGRHHEGKASRIWRVRPDGTGLECFAGGGFDNPVEVVFTDAGDMFGTMTYFTDPRDGQRDSVLHFVEGGVYPKPHPSMEEFPRTGDLMPVMTKFARVAPSGLLRYRGTAFGAECRGNLFSAHFNAHRIQRHKVFPQGATFRTEDSDFFVSVDPDLHPTDVMEDRDGSLVVVDTGAWFIHGCPLSRVAKPDVRGAFYRVRRTGSKNQQPSPADRDLALDQLVEQGDVDKLVKMRLQASSIEESASAVFGLYRIGGAKALAALREALQDQHAEVRQAAARQLGMARDRAAVPALMELVRKDSAPVRRQAAASIGQIGDARAVPVLLEALATTADDRFVEHSLIYSLIQLRTPAPLVTRLSDPAPSVRKAALIALDQMNPSPLREPQVIPFLNDSELELRRAALWVVSRHPAWSANVARAVEARFRAPQFGPREAEMTGEAIAAFCGDASMRASIAGALGDASLAADRQLFLLEAAERCSTKELPAEWTAGLRRLLDHKDRNVRFQDVNLIRARGVATLDSDLRRLASASTQPDDIRVAAISAVLPRQPQLGEPDFDYLTGRTRPNVEAGVKLAAGQVLGRARFTDEQLIQIAQRHLKAADPMVLPSLLDGFRHSRNEYVGQALVRALALIESSLGTVGSQRVEQLIAQYPSPVQVAAAPLLKRLESARRARLERLKRLEDAVTGGGDVTRGRDLFFGAKAGCSGCHTIGERGGHVGPDLTSIGAIRSPHDLLEAIVLPSESFVPGHEVYRVETAREVYSGLMGKGTRDAIRLITGPGDEVRIPRKDIIKMGYAPVSLMPEGLDEVLTRKEMRDVIAFLRAQTSRAAAGATD